jgi:hypothetical protein
MKSAFQTSSSLRPDSPAPEPHGDRRNLSGLPRVECFQERAGFLPKAEERQRFENPRDAQMVVVTEAARFAIVHGADSGHAASTDDIKAIVTSHTIGLSAADLTTVVTFLPNQKAGSTTKVAVTFNFRPIAPYIPSGLISLKSTSQMVINQ